MGVHTELPKPLPIPINNSSNNAPLIAPLPGHPPNAAVPNAPPLGIQQMGPGGVGQQARQPEFDHARNFVKKIKLRFSNQPTIYKSFLEILHTYHKEQHTIKGVYNQVAKLFNNHPDLLDEFTQFLPETLPHAEERKRKMQTRLKSPSQPPPVNHNLVELNKAKKKQSGETINLKDKAPPPRVAPSKSEDFEFFKQLKQVLNNDLVYNDFIKCLSLYNNDVIKVKELLLFAQDVMSEYPHLFAQFKKMLKIKDAPMMKTRSSDTKDSGRENITGKRVSSFQPPFALDEEAEPIVPSQPFIEIDFMTCKRYGPSYRALPKNYQHPTCSGRKPEHQEVLNDTWVSIPTGTEDDGASFKASRKNQYEEVLFKCEDDRYELDLVVELNASCINFLEPIRDKLAEMDEQALIKFKITEKLDILHQRAIERVYGDKSQEIIEGFYDNTALAVPIIINRLKQKDKEWRKARREWNKVWREVAEKNYYKALDHQSVTFKNSEKKSLSSKVLVAQIKQKYQQGLKNAAAGEEQTPSNSVDKNNIPSPHLFHISASIPHIFVDIEDLIQHASESELAKIDAQKLQYFFEEFVRPFFGYSHLFPSPPTKTKGRKPRKSKTDKNAMEVEKNESPNENGFEMKPSHHFFGNRNFYLFFRLFCILYERLEKSIELEKQQKENNASFYEYKYAERADDNKGKSKAESLPRAKSYSELLALTKELISGNLDSGRFEDDCRELFGINSYILFTLDKLIQQLCKQIDNILNSEFCSKLIALHSFEKSKEVSFRLDSYKNNTMELFVSQGAAKKRCYYFRFSLPASIAITATASSKTHTVLAPIHVTSTSAAAVNSLLPSPPHPSSSKPTVDNSKSPTGNNAAAVGSASPSSLEQTTQHPLNVSLTDTKLSESECWSLEFTLLDNLEIHPQLQLEMMKEKWTRYVENYIQDATSDCSVDVVKNKIFLKRNKKTVQKQFPSLKSALKTANLVNGLECRICMSTFKIFYINGTSDFYHRKRSPPKTKPLLNKRKQRWTVWLEKRQK